MLLSEYYTYEDLQFTLDLTDETAKQGSLKYEFTIQYFIANITYPEWNNDIYSTAGFNLTLERRYWKHLLSYYLPSLLFVLASWTSFLIPPEIVPGRLALLITLLLVLLNLFSTVIRTQPPAKYSTVLEIWILFCMLFVCGALFAYALLLFQLRGPAWRTVKFSKEKKVLDVQPKAVTDHNNVPNHNQKPFDASQWDMTFLICFPLAFLAFNMIYWPVVFTSQAAARY